jgi:hypothetical protein
MKRREWADVRTRQIPVQTKMVAIVLHEQYNQRRSGEL